MNTLAFRRTTGSFDAFKRTTGSLEYDKNDSDIFDPLVPAGDCVRAAVTSAEGDTYDSDETDSAPSSGSNSLIQSSSGPSEPVPVPAEMAVVEVVPRKSVQFTDTVSVREEYYDASANKVNHVDTVAEMKKAAVSRPTIEPVTFDKKEEEIRSKLVGLIPAQKRRHHDYGRMYGCGPCLARTESTNDLDEDYDSEEDSDLDSGKPLEPVRVIHASEPSAMWFSAGLL